MPAADPGGRSSTRIYCADVKVNPRLFKPLNYKSESYGLSLALVRMLREGMARRGQDPDTAAFAYDVRRDPLCAPSANPTRVTVTYSAKDTYSPIAVTWEIHRAGRSAVRRSATFRIADQIASGRLRPNNLTNTAQTAISNDISDRAGLIVASLEK